MVKSIRSYLYKIRHKHVILSDKANVLLEYLLDFFIKPMNKYLNFKRNIKNFFYWGWSLKEDRDFDHYFFEHILYLKVKRMYEYFKDSDIAVWTSSRDSEDYDPEEGKPLKALRIVYKILDRIENNSYGRGEKNLIKLFGEYKMYSLPIEGDLQYKRLIVKREFENDQNEEEVEKLSKYYRDREMSVKARDRRILFKLLETYVEYWWD